MYTESSVFDQLHVLRVQWAFVQFLLVVYSFHQFFASHFLWYCWQLQSFWRVEIIIMLIGICEINSMSERVSINEQSQQRLSKMKYRRVWWIHLRFASSNFNQFDRLMKKYWKSSLQQYTDMHFSNKHFFLLYSPYSSFETQQVQIHFSHRMLLRSEDRTNWFGYDSVFIYILLCCILPYALTDPV